MTSKYFFRYLFLSVLFFSYGSWGSVIPGLSPKEWQETFFKATLHSTLSKDQIIEGGYKLDSFVYKSPFHNETENRYWYSLVEVKKHSFDAEVEFPTPGFSVDKTIYETQLGVGVIRKEKVKWGYWLGVNSASDRPLNSLKTTSVDISALCFTPSGENEWLWMVSYSSLRTFLSGLPLPGFAYVHKPHKNYVGVYGIPFSMFHWIDFPKYQFYLQLSPMGVYLRYAKGIMGPVQVFAEYKKVINSFAPAARQESEDRLVYKSNNYNLGVFAPLSKKVMFEMSLSQLTDQEVYLGSSIFSTSGPVTSVPNQMQFETFVKFIL